MGEGPYGNNGSDPMIDSALPGESATARAAHASLKGHRRGLQRLWPFLGPAFVAAVAYVDPGNFATNIAGGAKYGYTLLWGTNAMNAMKSVRATPGCARPSRSAAGSSTACSTCAWPSPRVGAMPGRAWR